MDLTLKKALLALGVGTVIVPLAGLLTITGVGDQAFWTNEGSLLIRGFASTGAAFLALVSAQYGLPVLKTALGGGSSDPVVPPVPPVDPPVA